ncbi:zinc finger protein 26-like [Argonauta hians]
MSEYGVDDRTNVDDDDGSSSTDVNKEKTGRNSALLSDSDVPVGTETEASDGTLSMEFVLDDKASFSKVPDVTSSEESKHYMLINVQDLLSTVWGEIGTPFLMLPNEKGNSTAKIMYRKTLDNDAEPLPQLPPPPSLPPPPRTSPLSRDTTKQQQPACKTDQTSSSSHTNRKKTELKAGNSLEISVDPALHHPPVTDDMDLTDTSQSDKDNNDGTERLYAYVVEDNTNKLTSVSYKRYEQNGQRIFECLYEGCGRTFAWPAHLKYHQLTHTGERQYACSSSGCKKTFYTSQRLAVHIRTHTGEKPFRCQEEGCDKAFTTAGNLKNHIRVHTGERPFVCNHAGCNRGFAEYSSLRKHKLVHTGEKPFVCCECGKMFSQSGSRTVHIKRHHGAPSKKAKKDGQILSSKENSATEDSSPNIFVLQNSEESLLQYQDFPGSESVVITPGMSDHIVTVTTQPSEEEGDQGHTVISPDVLSTTAEDLSENNLAHVPLSPSSDCASVMVLSQPEEIISIGSSYEEESLTEDIILGNELLPANLEQKVYHWQTNSRNISG